MFVNSEMNKVANFMTLQLQDRNSLVDLLRLTAGPGLLPSLVPLLAPCRLVLTSVPKSPVLDELWVVAADSNSGPTSLMHPLEARLCT